MRIAFCISMQHAETALQAVKGVHVDRFFLAPLNMEEMLREVAGMCGVEVLPPLNSHADRVAAGIRDAWDRARDPTLLKVDKLDDAAIALLDNSLGVDLRKAAEYNALQIAEVTTKFGFDKAARISKDIAERLSRPSLVAAEGAALSEELLALRQSLLGPPAVPAPAPAPVATPGDVVSAFDESLVEGRRVLVVDDEPMVSRGLSSLLGRRGLAVTAVNDPLRFWSALEEANPNLILLDLEMPKMSGTELCRVVRGDRRWSEVPVIFLTGHTDRTSVQRIFAAGADDYVGKPFVPAELMMRIESRLASVKARKAPLETDPLTGLATATKATELIDRFLRLARRKSDPYSIAVLQVDGFVSLAATFGRALCDSVLRNIGELLARSFRAEDVPGWWGGADFTIGMYGSSKEHAAIKLAQICAKIAELNFLAEEGRRVNVSCSGGVAQYLTDGDTIRALREESLKALEQARSSGAAARVGISGARAGAMTRRVDVAIVDDDAALVSLLQHAMESRSMRVACYADGETAVAALTGGAPQVQAALILLGIDLPALDGLDVLRRLKASGVTRSSSVVMLASRAGEREVLAALDLGATDHITKPLSVPILMHKVRSVLKQGPG
jgi:diguanylate cyclase (GGDEF)-like protein